jgi:hypothetical protein
MASLGEARDVSFRFANVSFKYSKGHRSAASLLDALLGNTIPNFVDEKSGDQLALPAWVGLESQKIARFMVQSGQLARFKTLDW